MKLLLFSLFFLFSAQAKYLDNHSCKECHEQIYEEFQSSMHAKSYFSDELHRKVADKVSGTKYGCAVCHMPMADNLVDLISGKARPDKNNKTHTDAISCFFCHTIAYVKKSHKFNINTKARQAKGYKPTLYGRLTDPEKSDKHSSVTNPMYAKNVCKGCHSHKINDNNVTVFRAMDEKQDSLACIECHMPEITGGAEKLDKRARGQHASHKFLGLHDAAFRATGVDINITIDKEIIMIALYNKMAHPLIVQPARVKYLRVRVLRGKKVLWQNYEKEPSDDKAAFFEYRFKGEDGKQVIIPAQATGVLYMNNLQAKEKKTFRYRVGTLQKGDKIEVALYVRLAKKDCQRAIMIEDRYFNTPILLKKVEKTLP
jgi:hypothetical protein